MHLTRESRDAVKIFCAEQIYHHLMVEFDCAPPSLEDNIKEKAIFYQQNNSEHWIRAQTSKVNHYAGQYERCQPLNEGPLITVKNSEDPLVHAVTARGVQGSLQTSILGVLSSPVVRQQLYYFSRHGESDYNVLGRIGGDADLSSRGRSYAERLSKFLDTTPGVVRPKCVSC